MNRDSKCAAAATIFKKLNPHTGWIKKGSSPYAKPEAIGRDFFLCDQETYASWYLHRLGYCSLISQTWPGYWSLRDRLPTSEPTPSPLSSFPKDIPHPWRSPVLKVLLISFSTKTKMLWKLLVSSSSRFCPTSSKEKKACHAASMAWGTDEVLVLHKGTEVENCH